MKRSTNRILTSHTGALVRPAGLHEMLLEKEQGKRVDAEALDLGLRQAVAGVVKKQVEVGVDVPNDGEQSKVSYATYVINRLNGFGGAQLQNPPRPSEVAAFPSYFANRRRPQTGASRLACVEPLSWKDFPAVEKDIDNLKAATKGVKAEDVFMSAASPGIISTFCPNKYYPTHAAYVEALGTLMKREYEAVAKAGFTLQLDCPELALSRDSYHSDLTLEQYRKVMEQHVEVLNFALSGIPAENLRMHVCWGRPEAPKTSDIPLKDIADIILKAKPLGISIVAANGRHAFEWKVWKDHKNVQGRVLMPGVIDNTTNIVEHPETVAERFVRYADVVGRENVIGGTDCGFGGAPTGTDVDPTVAWAKLHSMAEGAAIATKGLWKK